MQNFNTTLRLMRKITTPAQLIVWSIYWTTPASSWAQETWQWRLSGAATTGQYADAIAMKNQHGWGIRLTGEQNNWGLTAGLQSTRIGMHAIAPSPQQTQDDWLLSGYLHKPSQAMPGRWTVQVDAYQTSNDALQSISSHVRALAPQISWQSYSLPLKIDLGYAHSRYQHTKDVAQMTAGFAFGFNNAQDWIQLRNYSISSRAKDTGLHASTNGTDIKLTHLFAGGASSWLPASITLGLERGQRIHAIDLGTQTLYNLPMVNEGGGNVAVSWKLSSNTDWNFQWSKNQYRTELPWIQRFKLSTLSTQISKTW